MEINTEEKYDFVYVKAQSVGVYNAISTKNVGVLYFYHPSDLLRKMYKMNQQQKFHRQYCVRTPSAYRQWVIVRIPCIDRILIDLKRRKTERKKKQIKQGKKYIFTQMKYEKEDGKNQYVYHLSPSKPTNHTHTRMHAHQRSSRSLLTEWQNA